MLAKEIEVFLWEHGGGFEGQLFGRCLGHGALPRWRYQFVFEVKSVLAELILCERPLTPGTVLAHFKPEELFV